MALSRLYTAGTFWREVVRDLGTGVRNVPQFDRYFITNRAQIDAATAVYDLISNSYMTPIPVQTDTVGSYFVSGASWTAASKTLTATMSSTFSASDLDKSVMFRSSGSVYLATVDKITSTTAVVLKGFNLPITDIPVVDDIMLAPTAYTADSISLSSINFMRAGQEIKFEFESSATESITRVSLDGLRVWKSSGGNRNKIIFCLSGDSVLLKKGDGLTTYGTLIFRYPRVPTSVVTDNDLLDIPDGGVIRLAILRAKTLLAQRLTNIQIPDQTPEIFAIVQSLHQALGGEPDTQLVKSAVESLK